LPRIARLMVALRQELLGPRRDESSFLFLVEGRGREGMGLHHDGDVDAFWVQLEGRRTATLGPPVAPRTPLDLDGRRRGEAGWHTLDLPPGSLLYLPPRIPHTVVCHGRSLALSLTWSRRRARVPRTAWDVVSGRASPRPRQDPRWLWTQVPVTAGAVDRVRRRFRLHTPDRAVTAGASSVGFLVATAYVPFLGMAMDRWGPRVVIPIGIVITSLGLALAPLTSRPWHLHVTLGALVGGGSIFMTYIGHSLFLPHWFVRRRGLAIGVAFSGVGIGSIVLFPWLGRLIAASGWRAACWALVILLVVVLLPLNLT